MDFSTLEKVNASSVADDPRNRHDAVVWRVRFRDHWLYVDLLLEFQSTVDRFMAVRILSDTGLLYQDLIRGQSLHQDRLPPVLPIVLYQILICGSPLVGDNPLNRQQAGSHKSSIPSGKWYYTMATRAGQQRWNSPNCWNRFPSSYRLFSPSSAISFWMNTHTGNNGWRACGEPFQYGYSRCSRQTTTLSPAAR
ncbi:MAG: hypothetical protein CTR54_22900 [Rhizobium sp.]|nr:MAG: hypothetical protein CTR54_22900 [Rhizobium sp.]